MHCIKLVTHPAKNFAFKNLTCSQKSKTFLRWNHKVNLYCTVITMEDYLEPPKSVKGMKVLDKSAFNKRVTVPCLEVKLKNIPFVINLLKQYLLKNMHIKVIASDGDKRKILLNPNLIKEWNDFDEKVKTEFQKLEISKDNLLSSDIDLGYDNWKANSLIKAILPEDESNIKSFSVIGHIIHLNLKEDLLDYKYIVADILLDKTSFAKTIVYKKKEIQNVYRNFEMEVIRGEPNFIVSVKEHNCNFEFDFSKVYWNPRLSTEHQRIINQVSYLDVLFDVFAGVGPFAIPAAKKQCKVFANDLNPDSYKWLNHSISLNKKAKEYITTFNKDGGDFILTDARLNLIKIWQDELFSGKIYFVMNLPAIAPEFLKYFKGLITKDDTLKLDLEKVKKCLPIIHCHFFALKTEDKKDVFEKMSGIDLNNIEHTFNFVRNVSVSKDMFRITFKLPFNYITAAVEESDEPLPKRLCTQEAV